MYLHQWRDKECFKGRDMNSFSKLRDFSKLIKKQHITSGKKIQILR